MMWRRRDDGKTKRASKLKNLRVRSWQCTNCVQSSSLWTSTSKSFNVVWFFAESYCKMRIESQLKRSRLCITCTFEFISLSCVAGRNTQSSMAREHGALKEEVKNKKLSQKLCKPHKPSFERTFRFARFLLRFTAFFLLLLLSFALLVVYPPVFSSTHNNIISLTLAKDPNSHPCWLSFVSHSSPSRLTSCFRFLACFFFSFFSFVKQLRFFSSTARAHSARWCVERR